jgi:hypothetical protein
MFEQGWGTSWKIRRGQRSYIHMPYALENMVLQVPFRAWLAKMIWALNSSHLAFMIAICCHTNPYEMILRVWNDPKCTIYRTLKSNSRKYRSLLLRAGSPSLFIDERCVQAPLSSLLAQPLSFCCALYIALAFSLVPFLTLFSPFKDSIYCCLVRTLGGHNLDSSYRPRLHEVGLPLPPQGSKRASQVNARTRKLTIKLAPSPTFGVVWCKQLNSGKLKLNIPLHCCRRPRSRAQ